MVCLSLLGLNCQVEVAGDNSYQAFLHQMSSSFTTYASHSYFRWNQHMLKGGLNHSYCKQPIKLVNNPSKFEMSVIMLRMSPFVETSPNRLQIFTFHVLKSDDWVCKTKLIWFKSVIKTCFR